MTSGVRVELVARGETEEIAPALAEVLLDCVDDGASVGFLSGFSLAGATRWWLDALAPERTLTWVARCRPWPDVVGVVQLKMAAYPNGSHRADVVKLLVHRRARGRGVASALMSALEAEAVRRGRWLLLLDTETDSLAEGLYEAWGWQRVGVVEDHAAAPDGTLRPTTFFAKRLDGAVAGSPR
jgi:GNAT superfamily N-acetyltransferase